MSESRSCQLSLEDKEYELQKTKDDLEGLKGVIEYNLGCMEAEKRWVAVCWNDRKFILLNSGKNALEMN